MRGTELAARGAAARCRDWRVLLMSGFSAELLDADRDAPPAWELLRKPYTPRGTGAGDRAGAGRHDA